MRVKTSIFVSSLIRAEAARGAFCAILRKGAEDAGTVFIIHNRGDRTCDFYGPVSQYMLGQQEPGGRYFELLESRLDESEISGKIEKQVRFDPDCWAVEIETPKPLQSIDIIQPG